MRIKRAVFGIGLCVLAAACEDDARDDDPNAGAAGSGSVPMAAATISPFGMGAVTGTVTFMQMGTNVTATVSLSNCPDGPHGVHIHQGTACTDAMAQGDHWGPTRGEGIPNVMCAAGVGTATVTRTAMDPVTSWTIGGAADTNVVGHAFVVHDPGMPAPRIGCGVIQMK